jgi:hypothetical protein
MHKLLCPVMYGQTESEPFVFALEAQDHEMKILNELHQSRSPQKFFGIFSAYKAFRD